MKRNALNLGRKYLTWNHIYWIFVVFLLVMIFAMGDSNLYQRYLYDKKIRELELEIEKFESLIEKSKTKLDDLRTNKKGLEQFAREEYLMKRSDEDLYIIKND